MDTAKVRLVAFRLFLRDLENASQEDEQFIMERVVAGTVEAEYLREAAELLAEPAADEDTEQDG